MKRILSIVEAEEAFSKRTIHYLGRTDKFKHGLRKEKRFVQLAKEHQWSKEDMEMAEFLIDMPAAFGLHKSMWITTVRNQGTEEQHKMFLEPSLNFDIIG
jgi:acyl-CoA oxidase